MDDSSLNAKWHRLVEHGRQPFDPEALPFPTEAQLDLLKAALLPAEHAKPAWQRWKERGHRLETIYGPSTRLFPQLWAKRDAAGIGAEDLPILKGAYRHTLAENAMKLRAALNATQPLVEAGIPVLLFKGAAMITIAGERLGLRPIADVDVLVPEKDAERCVSLLLEYGHKPTLETARIGLSHAWSCRDLNGSELDLHWWAFKTAGDDSGIFDAAREATLLGQPMLVPSATDCLVVAVANAFPDQGSPLRWITDSMLLFQCRGDEIDWEVLLKRARRTGLTLGLADGLDFLAREFSAPIPAYVIAELRRRPVSWQEHAAHRVAVNPPPMGATLFSHLVRQKARREHGTPGLPQDLLWHLTQVTRGPQARRRDLLINAPRRAVRNTALLVIRYGSRTTPRSR
jgi:hypothetical protein